jgi:type III secretion protein R
VQQVPANMAIYGIALIMTVFVMAPTFREMTDILAREQPHATESQGAMDNIGKAMEPLRTFMLKHARDDQRERFLEKAKRLWPEDQAANATANDFVVVVPAFMVSEMQAAFEMGFLMYIPFLVIDMIVSNILLALGMQMVSPMTVSLPLKLFIFVVIDGWGKLLDSILNTYL